MPSTITYEKFKTFNPPEKMLDWYENKFKEKSDEQSISDFIEYFRGDQKDLAWLITNLLNDQQKIKMAIFCAELMLPYLEKYYQNDSRASAAVNAAKNVFKDNTAENRKDAIYKFLSVGDLLYLLTNPPMLCDIPVKEIEVWLNLSWYSRDMCEQSAHTIQSALCVVLGYYKALEDLLISTNKIIDHSDEIINETIKLLLDGNT